jgi:hypothetical protein
MRCDEPGALYCLRGNGWRLRRTVCGRRPGPLCLPSGDYARLPGPIQKHFCRILESGQYSPFFGLFQGFGTPFSIPDERSRNSGMGLMTTGSAVHQATRNGSRPAPLLVLTSELGRTASIPNWTIGPFCYCTRNRRSLYSASPRCGT